MTIRKCRSLISSSSPAQWHPTLITLFTSAVAGYEDYEAAGFSLAVPEIEYGAAPLYHGGDTPSAFADWFIEGDTGTGAIIVLTMTTVLETLGRPFLDWERAFIAINHGHMQWSAAAVLLGLNCLHPALLRLCIEVWRLHTLPLSAWREDLKSWMNALRRCPTIASCPEVGPDEILMLRKVFTCTWRAKDEADWAAEHLRRQSNTPVHYGINSRGELCRQTWLDTQNRYMALLANEVIGATISEAKLDSLDEWWAARWAWTPAGSSSQRRVAQVLKEADPRLGTNARPNKKAVFEELPDCYPRLLQAAYPAKYPARASTKPEPGGKARALYAVNDEAFVISAYASVHIEKHMNVWGIKAKQTPADVVAWIAADRRKPPGSRYLSQDYSDYNSDHELLTLSQMNVHLALAWHSLGRGRPATVDKVWCTIWAAAAHHNQWVHQAEGNWRVGAGLFSGDRDTARDNTLLHGVYSRMGLEFTQLFDPDARILDANYTGDDEDSLITDELAALNYYMVHTLMGFELKPAKQMCSAYIHEFLQRMAIPNGLPTRPLFAMLSQLASGNWYQDVHIWFDSAIQSISDNIWELVSRGMPIIWARRLACNVISATMRARRDDGSWKLLEWWQFRNAGIGPHPLWAGTGGIGLPPPSIMSKPDPDPVARGLATRAWVAKKRSELPTGSENEWKAYAAVCMQASYSGFYAYTRSRTQQAFALNIWPERFNYPATLDCPAPPRISLPQIEAMILAMPTERRPASEAEILARMGLDPVLVSSLGGMASVLKVMRPDILKFYSQPDMVGYVPISLSWLDPAIRSWYACTARAKADPLKDRELRLSRQWPIHHMDVPGMQNDTRLLLLAPNAAGKSTFIASNPWCADSDPLFGGMRLKIEQRYASHIPTSPRSTMLMDLTLLVLEQQGYKGIATQLPPDWILPIPSRRTFALLIWIVEPPEPLLRKRTLERGWDQAKHDRRLHRWRSNIRSWLANPQNLTLAEHAAIRHSPTFPQFDY